MPDLIDDDDVMSECYWTANYRERPDDTDGWEQTMVVHQSCPNIIVEISDIVTHPESWGRELALIADVICGEIAAYNDMTEEEALALIQKGWADFWGGGIN